MRGPVSPTILLNDVPFSSWFLMKIAAHPETSRILHTWLVLIFVCGPEYTPLHAWPSGPAYNVLRPAGAPPPVGLAQLCMKPLRGGSEALHSREFDPLEKRLANIESLCAQVRLNYHAPVRSDNRTEQKCMHARGTRV